MKLEKLKIGFEFEFFTNALTDEEITVSLSKFLQKKIRKPGVDYDNFVPSEYEFKLMTDTSGGPKMRELVTGPLNYEESRKILLAMLSWIGVNGYTTDKCSLHVNISEDSFEFKRISEIKLRLNIDEDLIYSKFPSRKNNVYCRSVKTFIPLNFSFINQVQNLNSFSFALLSSKYYGINFTKLSKGYLEFRYIGGKGYEKNIVNVIECFEVFLKCIEDSMNDYDSSDVMKLASFTSKLSTQISHFYSVETLRTLKNFQFSVDLKSDDMIISSFLMSKRLQLIEIFFALKPQKGSKIILNYDSDMGKFQLFDFEGIAYEIPNLEFIQCRLRNSNFVLSDFYECEISSSILSTCNLFSGVSVSESKLENCYCNSESSSISCYFDGVSTVFNGKASESIFRKGRIAELAKIDNTCTLMDTVKIPAGFVTIGSEVIIDKKKL